MEAILCHIRSCGGTYYLHHNPKPHMEESLQKLCFTPSSLYGKLGLQFSFLQEILTCWYQLWCIECIFIVNKNKVHQGKEVFWSTPCIHWCSRGQLNKDKLVAGIIFRFVTKWLVLAHDFGLHAHCHHIIINVTSTYAETITAINNIIINRDQIFMPHQI